MRNLEKMLTLPQNLYETRKRMNSYRNRQGMPRNYFYRSQKIAATFTATQTAISPLMRLSFLTSTPATIWLLGSSFNYRSSLQHNQCYRKRAGKEASVFCRFSGYITGF